MSTVYTISEDLVVTLSGSVEVKIPLNPETNQKFKTLEEAEAWAIAACAKINLEPIGTVKIWTPYQFMVQLPPEVLAGIITLEKSGDTTTLIALKMWNVAQDMRANDPNLITTLDYWITKGVLTEAQKNAILGV